MFRTAHLSRQDGFWDRIAMGVSALCLVHCVATVAVLAILSSAAGALFDPLIHEIGMGLAMALAMFALGRGVLDHGYIMPAAIGGLGLGVMLGALQGDHGMGELAYTMIGVGILALAHDLNYRAVH